MNLLKIFCSLNITRQLIRKWFGSYSPSLTTQLFGLSFKNPVGLGAGFDKNAKYLRELEALGFGFLEIGTITPKPQYGNDKPRLFRLPKDKALINRMGFNNDGVDAVAKRLKKWRNKFEGRSVKFVVEETSNLKPGISKILIGGNIGKNKTTPNEDAWKDYEICFRALHPFVDFFVVNVSSPNTPGLRELQEKESLKKILTSLQTQNKTFQIQRPILLKIAPDLSFTQIDDIIKLAKEIKLDGLVATNTTVSREELKTNDATISEIGAGGLSGQPLKKKSSEIIQYIVERTAGSIPVIGSGGIFSPADAKEKIAAGASLLEVWTGFIYQGPFIVKRICGSLS